MPGDYKILAPVYEKIGFADFAKSMTSRLIDFAHQKDWMGTRITDIGCGTGESIDWLAQHGFTITGLDNSAEMLEIAREKTQQHGPTLHFEEHDFRDASSTLSKADLLIAIGLLNEMNNLREIEAIFANAQELVDSNQWFMFDVFTIEGLAQRSLDADELHYDDGEDLAIYSRNVFDYERQVFNARFTIFQNGSEGWQRQDADYTLRAFPIQAIATLLQRQGFTVEHLLQTNFMDFEPGKSGTARVIFVAKKN